MTSEVVKEIEPIYPLKRIGHAREVSSAILFAASEEASYITGSNIFVEGGMLAGNLGADPTKKN